MNTNKVVKIIKLHAEWCSPCKAFKKTFDEIKGMEQYKDIEFNEIDIEDEEVGEPIVEKYEVKTVPTTLLLDENGDLIYKIIGNIPLNDLTEVIDKAMSDRKDEDA